MRLALKLGLQTYQILTNDDEVQVFFSILLNSCISDQVSTARTVINMNCFRYKNCLKIMKSKSNCIDSSVEWNKGVPFIPGCWSHSPRKVYIGCHNGWLSPMLQFESHGFNVALKLK